VKTNCLPHTWQLASGGHATRSCTALFYTPKRLWTRNMGLGLANLLPKAAVDP
jgi:hypothetical protein